MDCWSVLELTWLFLGAAAHSTRANGLIERLPDDGVWAAFAYKTKSGEQEAEARLTISSVGREARDNQSCRWIELKLESGNETILTKLLYRGKIVLIDCWATWCSLCMAKMPKLKKLYERWYSRGLEIIGVNCDTDWQDAEKAIAKLEITWPQIHMPTDKEARKLWWDSLGVSGIPQLLLIDRQGKLASRPAPGELEDAIGRLIDSTP